MDAEQLSAAVGGIRQYPNLQGSYEKLLELGFESKTCPVTSCQFGEQTQIKVIWTRFVPLPNIERKAKPIPSLSSFLDALIRKDRRSRAVERYTFNA